jgi:hypothetical protein
MLTLYHRSQHHDNISGRQYTAGVVVISDKLTTGVIDIGEHF